MWWSKIEEKSPKQGDLIENCRVPVIPDSWNPSENGSATIDVEIRRLVVLTQSCDLVQNKVSFVLACPVSTIEEYAETFKENKPGKSTWEQIRQSKQPSLHMLTNPRFPSDNSKCFIVDFRQSFSLPIGFVKGLYLGDSVSYRLNSPYLEHLAQAYARFFMRVGLPNDIPKFQ